MEPGKYDIRIRRGRTWKRAFRWLIGPEEDRVPVNLTGYTAATNLDPRGDLAEVAGVATIRDQSVGANLGWIDVVYDDSVTSTLLWEEGEWFLTLTDPAGEPSDLIEGLVRVRD